jgi:hypothetical protein
LGVITTPIAIAVSAARSIRNAFIPAFFPSISRFVTLGEPNVFTTKWTFRDDRCGSCAYSAQIDSQHVKTLQGS